MRLFEILKSLVKWGVRIISPCERSVGSSQPPYEPPFLAQEPKNISHLTQSDSPSSTSTEPRVVFVPGFDSPFLNYIEERDDFRTSMGIEPDMSIHDWLAEPLVEGSPTPVLCAICSHEWLGTILNRVLVEGTFCPECGATAGMLPD